MIRVRSSFGPRLPVVSATAVRRASAIRRPSADLVVGRSHAEGRDLSRILTVCLATVLVAGCDTPTATEWRTRSEPTMPSRQADEVPIAVVGAFGCAVIRGGQVTRPAGSQVRIAQGWSAKSKGLMVDYLQAQTTTIIVNGGPPIDVSDAYSPPAPDDFGTFGSDVGYDTGIVLAAGESMTFVVSIVLSHRLNDGYTFEDDTKTKKPFFFGPGLAFEFPCTVTGIA